MLFLLTKTMVNIVGKICFLQEKALLSLVTELLVISRGTGESEESILNKQTALYSLKLLSRLLCKDYPNEFKEVRRFVLVSNLFVTCCLIKWKLFKLKQWHSCCCVHIAILLFLVAKVEQSSKFIFHELRLNVFTEIWNEGINCSLHISYRVKNKTLLR